MSSTFSSALLVTLGLVSFASAEIIGNPKLVKREIAGTPSGYTTYGLFIDFEGQLFGQQLVVKLISGSLFQQVTFGTDDAPSPALMGAFPDVEADTFVSIGGFYNGGSFDTLIVGGSTELGMNGPKKIDTEGINIAWAPAPGVVIDGGVNFPIAQLTFSDDAEGTLMYFGNAGGVGRVFPTIYLPRLPEPATGLIALLGMLGAAVPTARTRRSCRYGNETQH